MPRELTRCSVIGSLRAGADGRPERPDNVPPRKRWHRPAMGVSESASYKADKGLGLARGVNLGELLQPSL